MGVKLVTGAMSPKLSAPAVVGTLATVALATGLVGQIASITALIIPVAVTEETPWSLTGLPLKTMQKVVRILQTENSLLKNTQKGGAGGAGRKKEKKKELKKEQRY